MQVLAAKFLLQREISKLNKAIDERIKSKKPYKREAQLHKKLLKKLNALNKRSQIEFLFA